jgi:hypothetical protein
MVPAAHDTVAAGRCKPPAVRRETEVANVGAERGHDACAAGAAELPHARTAVLAR